MFVTPCAMSNYAKRMTRLSARIFGEVIRPTNNKSMKVVQMYAVKPTDKVGHLVDYYPRLADHNTLRIGLRKLGLFRDELADFKDEMKRLRALKGKVPTKKGEGKRAAKRK